MYGKSCAHICACTHIVGCYVASATSKTLGEGPHHYVNVGRVYPPVLHHTSASFPHCSNAVCLIQVQISLYKVGKKKKTFKVIFLACAPLHI